MRELADSFIDQAEYQKRSTIYTQMTTAATVQIVDAIRNSFNNKILEPILDHPQLIYKSMLDITQATHFNGTYKQLIYEILR